eukprot:CAMPEP_0197532636 /NCGR_PEP_ID=MMETSP1318-20131121/40457_1 /TAXON_ID=552666 /ORGANISM="Partenskyella glossopodia, Strain RCC365" /LENGTH=134 /DNA_ID=CAMNT_0043089267 /DNA_START=26 /DNA_END=427 /DNA_ORIENTATION=-
MAVTFEVCDAVPKRCQPERTEQLEQEGHSEQLDSNIIKHTENAGKGTADETTLQQTDESKKQAVRIQNGLESKPSGHKHKYNQKDKHEQKHEHEHEQDGVEGKVKVPFSSSKKTEEASNFEFSLTLNPSLPSDN